MSDKYEKKKGIGRVIELITGDRVDRLELAYATAPAGERLAARYRFVEEKAKHRVTMAAVAVVTAVVALALDRILPEA